MSRRTKLSRSTGAFIALLRDSSSRVFSAPELAKIFYAERGKGAFAQNTKVEEVISTFISQGHLHKIALRSKKYRQTKIRYSVGDPSAFELAQSLRRSGYLSHGTAAYLHSLSGDKPTTLYLNIEQSHKPRSENPLTQDALERAFSRKQRTSALSFSDGKITITLLSGKHTADRGVEDLIGPGSEHLRVTSLERTLIDIAVRPAYAGGINHVLACYRKARDRVDVGRVTTTLSALEYAYPYAQSIGFLLQRAGIALAQLQPLKAQVSELNFYLVYGMKGPRYDPAWKIFYPATLPIS